jgi:hypothetical protein
VLVLALTLPTGGGRSVGIVRSRTKATELFSVGVIDTKPEPRTHYNTNTPLIIL